MSVSKAQEHVCADCGITITGVPVMPWKEPGPTPTEAQLAKLKPTVFLCTECADERGLDFDHIAVGKSEQGRPSPV